MNRTGNWKLGRRFDDALAYAVELHRDQVRKGTDRNAAGEAVPPTPYLAHLLGVASLALEAGADEDEAIAALLHDAVEDQPHDGKTERDIRERFGPDVLAIVKGCTKPAAEAGLSPEEHAARRRAIRTAYFDHLRHAGGSVLLVSAADKLQNARAIVADLRERGPSALDRFKGKREETLWYYDGLVEALRQARAPGRLVNELAGTVAEMHALASDSPSIAGVEAEDAPDAPFVSSPVNELPPALAYLAVEEATLLARIHGVALDASGFTVAAAAVRDMDGYSNGEPVIGLRSWRAAGPIRFGGGPALLVAEVTAIDDETPEAALAREGVTLAVVPFAFTADAERIVLRVDSGHPIPRAPLAT